jgi:predicted dehydrogenase
MAQRIGMGLVGPGFIAAHHIDAVRRLGDVDVVALAGSSLASTQRKAAEFNVARSYATYEELVNDPAVHVVHNTTPSYLHLPVTLAALRANKHVISDKPLAMTAADCAQLRDAAADAGVVNAVTFNYRGNPMVQEARARIAAGEAGELVSIHGQYLQDWMTDANVYSWRMDPVKGGVSSALADIGSHWCDLAEHVSGLRIVSVLADITTVVKKRFAPAGGSSEAFAATSDAARTPVAIHGEDLATVLLRFSNGARGSLRVGQVLPGHKNDLQLELNGRSASFRWLQEEQNDLWIGRHDGPNRILTKDPALLSPAARPYARLPAGHQESWADAFANVVRDIYSVIRSGSAIPRPATLCTFADATRTASILEAMLESASAGGIWTDVNPTQPKSAKGHAS